MNNHPFAIVWLNVTTQEPALETFENIEDALKALKEFRVLYPNNRYHLYNLLD